VRPKGILRLKGYECSEDAYRAVGDEATVTTELRQLKPNLIILPPVFDSPPHYRTRELAAIAKVDSGLVDCHVLTMNSPWNQLGAEFAPDLFFPYEEDLAQVMDFALSQYASQTRQLDYVGIRPTNRPS